MNIIKTLSMLLLISTLMIGCGGGSGGNNNTPVETFSVTVSKIQISRTADQLDMPITATPIESAIITIR